MKYVSGEILTKKGLQKGYIEYDKKNIKHIGKGSPPKKPICKGLIVPSFVNAHTHIGDYFVRDSVVELPKNIEKLVAPPNGLKHRLLKDASDEDIIEGMERSIEYMIKSGTNYFCDFRENGILGICQLKTALKHWKISSIILSRPDSLEFNKSEIEILLKNSDGIALSSISDWDYSELKKIAKCTIQKNKIFALHASEEKREDIDKILDLKPNFLVHMLKASESDLIRVKENNIPIVICPRANSFFGLKPKFGLLKKINIDLLIGTDNAMIVKPNIIKEIKFVKSISNQYSVSDLLNMITIEARKALNLESDILGPNSKAGFVVLDKKTLEPLYISTQ